MTGRPAKRAGHATRPQGRSRDREGPAAERPARPAAIRLEAAEGRGFGRPRPAYTQESSRRQASRRPEMSSATLPSGSRTGIESRPPGQRNGPRTSSPSRRQLLLGCEQIVELHLDREVDGPVRLRRGPARVGVGEQRGRQAGPPRRRRLATHAREDQLTAAEPDRAPPRQGPSSEISSPSSSR